LLAIGAVTMVVSATALSWHGIMLSEAARLAPPGRVGAVTGGVLSFGQIGALSSPAVFSLLLGLSGGYSSGNASSVSMRELSQTTARSFSFASPSSSL
jgi:hypothetical protein